MSKDARKQGNEATRHQGTEGVAAPIDSVAPFRFDPSGATQVVAHALRVGKTDELVRVNLTVLRDKLPICTSRTAEIITHLDRWPMPAELGRLKQALAYLQAAERILSGVAACRLHHPQTSEKALPGGDA